MLDRLINLLHGRRRGAPYQGVVVRCADPSMVRWPGAYAVKADGSLDKRRPVSFDREAAAWTEGR